MGERERDPNPLVTDCDYIRQNISHNQSKGKGKGKAIPLQAWTDPEGSRRLRLPDLRQSAHEDGKVVSPTHRPPFPPGNIPGTHFC
jgi:hypothetical protein